MNDDGSNGKARHYRRHCPRCGGVFKQQDLQKMASKLFPRDAKERLFVYICDGRNKRKPHPPRTVMILEQQADGKDLDTILVKTIGLPEDKFDMIMSRWEEYMTQISRPKTWIGQEGQTIHITSKRTRAR